MGSKFKSGLLALIVLLGFALTGCTSAAPAAKAELEKRGFTGIEIVQENGTIATVWAGAPGTSCRFLLTVQTGGQSPGSIVLHQRSSKGEMATLNIPDPNIPMLKDPANWPQIANCWDPALQPAKG